MPQISFFLRNRHGEEQRRSLRPKGEESSRLVGPRQQTAPRPALRGRDGAPASRGEARPSRRDLRVREPPRFHPLTSLGRRGAAIEEERRLRGEERRSDPVGAVHLRRLRP